MHSAGKNLSLQAFLWASAGHSTAGLGTSAWDPVQIHGEVALVTGLRSGQVTFKNIGSCNFISTKFQTQTKLEVTTT